ncbi:MAG: histidine phosphatase family protein [Methanomassiliicoccus sp.]|nr:histidine phosphatase family protein [Methanomassiliicoccus sp.]
MGSMRPDDQSSQERNARCEVPELASLNCTPRGALLIRHAARYGADVALHSDGLTSAGREMARALGKRLGHRKHIRLFSSPVQRCVDTASLIAEGAGFDAAVTVTTMLGRPGTYVLNEEEVDKHLAVMGLNRFAVEWVNGRIPAKAMAPVPQGTEALISWVRKNLQERSDCLDIYVGHDLFLTPVLVNYLDYDIASKGLLGFLDGFTVTLEEGKAVLSYGRERALI